MKRATVFLLMKNRKLIRSVVISITKTEIRKNIMETRNNMKNRRIELKRKK